VKHKASLQCVHAYGLRTVLALLLQAVQRQGHASRLVQQLESVLQEAGLQQLAVVLEPDVS
jgi:hypothetical protein